MEIATIQVSGTQATVLQNTAIPAGLIGGYIRIEYTDPLWDSLKKTVVFRGNVIRDVVTSETTVTIPAETVAQPGYLLRVGFYGTGANSVQAIPTFWADLGMIFDATDPSGDESADPTLPLWAQLENRVSRLEGIGGIGENSGTVFSVANVSPDKYGNVPLTAAHIGALALSGGNMTGPINMNSKSLSGLSAPTEDTQAATKAYVDTAKLVANTYANTQAKKAAPRNLLDNSDFRNPVNQRGSTQYTGIKYSIDRWKSNHSDTVHKVTSNGLTVSGTGNPDLYQVLPDNTDKTARYTAVACDQSGNLYRWSGIPSATDTAPVCAYISNNKVVFHLHKAVTWKWAALYEGEYTVDTLPVYQPKGYAAELAECQRYYLTLNNYVRYPVTRISSQEIDFLVPIPVKMRLDLPTLAGTCTVLAGTSQNTDFSFSIAGSGYNAVTIRATKASHGLTVENKLSLQVTGASLSADL